MSVIIPPTQVRLGCPYKKSAWPFRRAPFSDFQCRVVDGFTLIELLTTVAIVVALAAMLFPVLKKGIESSSRAKCVSNLRQLGIAVQLCVSDNDMTYPYQPAGNAAPANMQTAFEWIAPTRCISAWFGSIERTSEKHCHRSVDTPISTFGLYLQRFR